MKATESSRLQSTSSTVGRRRLVIDGVLDIETVKWSSFLLGGLLTKNGYLEKDWRKEDELIDVLLGFNGTVWSHNGGRFDFLWFLGKLLERRIPAQVISSPLGVSTVKVNNLILRDSYHIVPMSLASALGWTGEKKAPTGYFCKCGRQCGGYCSFSRRMSYTMRAELSDYLRSDCEQLMKLLNAVQEYCDSHDLDICNTLGKSAMLTARRWQPFERTSWIRMTHDFARSAYYGGRCECYKTRAGDAYLYDRHSAYPAAMAEIKLPAGKKKVYTGTAHRHYGKPGIFQALVYVPAMERPPLPYRYDGKIGFPVGNVHGVWTGTELEHAESKGCSIQAITKALIWESEETHLSTFAKKLWGLRSNESNKTRARWLKLYANSLSGKLAQRPGAKNVMFCGVPEPCPSDGDCHGILCGVICCPHACSGKCRPWEKLDEQGRIWARHVSFVHDEAQPHWAAFITADARIELAEQMDHTEEPIYCATDAVLSPDTQSRHVGENLGEWQLTDKISDWWCVGPGRYRYLSSLGNPVVKCRGIQDPEKRWGEIVSNERIVQDNGVESFTSAARGVKFFRRKRRIVHSGARTDYIGGRRCLANGSTEPLTVQELQSLEKTALRSRSSMPI